ncbi:MAG TPA: metallophosphoesterase [Puia sp.]
MKRERLHSYYSLLTLTALLLANLMLPKALTAQTHPASADLSFTILQLNDIYEIAPLRGSDEGGLARVATIRKQLLQENPNTITVLAGDFVSPSLIGTLSYRDPLTQQTQKIAGKQMIDVLNKMGLDYVTFGNHEFDIRLSDLQQRINESSFTWVNSNVFRRTPTGLSAFVKIQNGQTDSILPYSIRTMTFHGTQTLRLGIIGATIPFNKADSIEYADPYESFIKTYHSIRSQCDVIIGITHLAREMDSLLASRLPGLDLIIGGHEHTNMKFAVGHPIIAKADANDKSVYIHRVTFSPDTKKVTIRSELKMVDKTTPSDETVNEKVQYWATLTDSILVSMGYHPNQALLMAKTPLDGRESSIRNGKTNYTRLIADALWYADTTNDVVLYNSGSLRSAPKKIKMGAAICKYGTPCYEIT